MTTRRQRHAPTGGGIKVFDLARASIERALRQRERYRYVKPRVEADGGGWRIVSPNCSRQVNPGGGDIPIALLRPDAVGRWQLHAHDDTTHTWVLRAQDLSLQQAMARLCSDPQREYWR